MSKKTLSVQSGAAKKPSRAAIAKTKEQLQEFIGKIDVVEVCGEFYADVFDEDLEKFSSLVKSLPLPELLRFEPAPDDPPDNDNTASLLHCLCTCADATPYIEKLMEIHPDFPLDTPDCRNFLPIHRAAEYAPGHAIALLANLMEARNLNPFVKTEPGKIGRDIVDILGNSAVLNEIRASWQSRTLRKSVSPPHASPPLKRPAI